MLCSRAHQLEDFEEGRVIQVHQGEVALKNSFLAVHEWLRHHGEVRISTAAGTPFLARSGTANRRNDVAEPVIKFYQDGKEYARAYACCWGRYYNCYRTMVGMYCESLDRALT